MWGSSWYLAAKEGHTNLVHGQPNDPEDIQKRAMVYISSNTILSIREEEIVPLGAITVDMGPPTGGSQCHSYIHIYSKYVASEPISRKT